MSTQHNGEAAVIEMLCRTHSAVQGEVFRHETSWQVLVACAKTEAHELGACEYCYCNGRHTDGTLIAEDDDDVDDDMCSASPQCCEGEHSIFFELVEP